MILTTSWKSDDIIESSLVILTTLAVLACLFWLLAKRHAWVRLLLMFLWVLSLPALFDRSSLLIQSILFIQTTIEAAALYLLFASETTKWLKNS